MKTFFFFFLFLPSFVLAGSGAVKLKKSGSGKVCFVNSKHASTCAEDESGTESGFVLGDTVYVFAQPEKGFRFAGWEGACEGSERIYEIEVVKKSSGSLFEVTAHFAKPGESLNVKVADPSEICQHLKESGQLKKGLTVEDCVKVLGHAQAGAAK